MSQARPSTTLAGVRRAASQRGRSWPLGLRLARDRILLLAFLLALWEIAALYFVNPLWISQPSAVAARLWQLGVDGTLWRHAWTTLKEAGLGLLLAFAVGIPIGILLARFKYGSAVVEPYIMALYSTPRVALAPLFIIWFGIDLLSKVMMAFSIVVFIFILNIHEGLKTIDKDLLDLLRTMRAPRAYVTRKVLIPWIEPWIIASLRLAIGSALIGAIVAELIGSSAGLGWYIEHSAGRLDTTGVFAGIVTLVVIAVLANAVVGQIEKSAFGVAAMTQADLQLQAGSIDQAAQRPTGEIRFDGIDVAFPGNDGDTIQVVRDFNLTIPPGQFVSIVGPSGCGKSTLLRVLSGLVDAAAGTALIDGQDAHATHERIGFMFQRDTLLPWASVEENIRVGTDLSAYPAGQVAQRISELVRFLKLAGFEKHKPHQLSGGMRQRVSLGRLLAYDPDIFLMDEPFGALDSQTKAVMGSELLRIWSHHRKTVLFVTHDIEEAVMLSDRVIVLSPRPGTVKLDLNIALPRPRQASELRRSPAYIDYVDRIWGQIDTPE